MCQNALAKKVKLLQIYFMQMQLLQKPLLQMQLLQMNSLAFAFAGALAFIVPEFVGPAYVAAFALTPLAFALQRYCVFAAVAFAEQ